MHNNHKLVKKAVSVFMACAMAVSAFGAPSLGSVSAAGTMSADQITEEMKIGWNIGNSLDATPSTSDVTKHETAWGNPVVTQELIDAVKAKGFNTVRVPTTWYPHVTEENGTYTIDPAWLDRVQEVVDYAYKQDMYVILNVHHENWINRADLGTAYDEMSPKLTQIWQQIATRFADYDQHLIFEGMNEPRAKDTDYEWGWGVPDECYDVVNKLCNDFVETVRSVESPYKDTRLLMIPGYCASHELHVISEIDFPEGDEYVAASVHAYSPYEFTMGKGDHSAFTEAYEASLDAVFKNIQSELTDKGIPVVIGEFGASDYGYTEARCDWAEYYLTWAKKLGIPCVLWDNDAVGNSDVSECHTYLNRDTCEWYEAGGAVVDSMMSVLNDSSIVWDSEEYKPSYDHADLSTGSVIWEGNKTITGSSSGVAVTPDQITAGEIAVKFTGTAPVIALMDSSWGNWTEIGPYEVDEANGIAYYDSDDIVKAWGGDASTIASLALKITSGECTYTLITALGEATISTGTKPTGTTTTTSTTPAETTTTVSTELPSVNGKAYTLDVNTMYTYSKMPEDDRMIGWAYTDFGIPEGEKVLQVDVELQAMGSSVGTWQGAFGSSTTVEPDYWTMTDQMEQLIEDKKGTITWVLDEATSEIIDPTNAEANVKFGVWWIDCDVFKVNTVTIYTDGNGGSESSTDSSDTTTTTTTTTTTETTTVSTTTKAPQSSTTIASYDNMYVQMAGRDMSDSEYLTAGEEVCFGIEFYNATEEMLTMRGQFKLSDALAEIATLETEGEWGVVYDRLFGNDIWVVNPDNLVFAANSSFPSENVFEDGELVFECYYTLADADSVKAAAEKYGIAAQQNEAGDWYYAFPIHLDKSFAEWEWVGTDEKNVYPDGLSIVETSYIYILADEPEDTTTTTTSTTTTTTTTTTSSSTSSTTTTSKTTTSTSKSTTTTTTTSKDPVWNDLIGDTNLDGKVSVLDIIRLNKYNAKIVQLNEQALRNAECKSDGVINGSDLTALMQYLVDLVASLPVA